METVLTVELIVDLIVALDVVLAVVLAVVLGVVLSASKAIIALSLLFIVVAPVRTAAGVSLLGEMTAAHWMPTALTPAAARPASPLCPTSSHAPLPAVR
jgi:hypothetical protein